MKDEDRPPLVHPSSFALHPFPEPLSQALPALSNLPEHSSPCRLGKLDPNLSRETLSKLYRFALLLAGSTAGAEWILARVFEEFATQIGQFRTEKHRTAYLVAKIRECAVADSRVVRSGGGAKDSTGDCTAVPEPPVAVRFSSLSEPTRSALALFYLDLFPVGELAAFLNVDMDELGGLLQAGRDRLAANQTAGGGELFT